MRRISLLIILIFGSFITSECVQANTNKSGQVSTVPQPPKLEPISKQDLEKLIENANKGDLVAQDDLVKRYHWDNFEDDDLDKVDIANWKNNAERASRDYQYAYVLISRNQLKKYPDLFKAMEAMADKGNAAYQNLMGIILSTYFVSDGKWFAFEYFRKAAAQGFAPGQLNLAYAYERGEGVAKNDKKAFDLYLKSAESGYAVAEFRLGSMYFEGRGTEENTKKATEWLEKSAAQGYPNAQQFIAFLKESGWDFKNPPKSGLAFTIAAADKGNIFAQKNLYSRYFNAWGVKKDEPKALSWLKKGAEQGDKEALKELGAYYYFKGGTEEETKQGVVYIEKAASLGDHEAQILLALLALNGLGPIKDPQKAIETLKAEADKGSILAEIFLQGVAQAQSNIQKDEKE